MRRSERNKKTTKTQNLSNWFVSNDLICFARQVVNVSKNKNRNKQKKKKQQGISSIYLFILGFVVNCRPVSSVSCFCVCVCVGECEPVRELGEEKKIDKRHASLSLSGSSSTS